MANKNANRLFKFVGDLSDINTGLMYERRSSGTTGNATIDLDDD